MIKWCERLYLDEDIKKKPEKWKRQVEKSKPALSLYCVCIASNPDNLFDIINCNEMLFRYYRQRELIIAGLAKSKDSAELLVQEMVEDMLKASGTINVKEYFGLDGKS